MRCPQCDYRLWNLTARACPECGRPFKPSEFEFLPGTVEFCCPHCDHPYLGQAVNGHLDPPEFDCLQCGRHVHMDDMLLRPGPGLKEEQTTTAVNPWFDTQPRTFLSRYLAAIWQGIVSPGLAAEGVPPDASRTRTVHFLSANAGLFSLINGLGMFFVMILVDYFLASGGPKPSVFLLSSFLIAIPVMVLSGLIVGVGAATVWAMSIQFMLHLLLCRPRTGLKRTYDAVALTSGIHVLCVVPCLGYYLIPLSSLAWIVTASIAVRRVQRTPAVRTVLAALTLPAIFLALGIMIATHISTPANPRTQTQFITDAVLDYARSHNGVPPTHALALVADQSLQPDDLVELSAANASTTQGIPAGAGTLDLFPSLPQNEQQARINRIVWAMPPGLIAHRLGDYVFTYHGLNLASAPPDAWIVIASPDPDQNQQLPTSYQVGRADGSVRRYAASSFPQALAAQNQLRATLSLAPLPDPQTITHAQPAVATTTTPPSPAATQPQAP